MTQSSRPQAEHVNNGYLDAGPYSATQWRDFNNINLVGDKTAGVGGFKWSRGPFLSYLNALSVSNPAGVTIQVETGAGLVNGHQLVSTAQTPFTPTTPVANPRIDIVVMVENNTAAAYNTNLMFPTSLVDYGGVASIPPYTARIAILRGTENVAPVAPTLIQTPTIFMTPLAQYQISVVPAISALTDRRDFVDAWIQYVFVPAVGGEDATLASLLEAVTAGVLYAGVNLADGSNANFQGGTWIVPEDYISNISITPVVIPLGTGDLYASASVVGGGCGEAYNTITDSEAATVIAVTTNEIECLSDLELNPTVEAGDMLRMTCTRFSEPTSFTQDTVGAAVLGLGFRITYYGWRR